MIKLIKFVKKVKKETEVEEDKSSSSPFAATREVNK